MTILTYNISLKPFIFDNIKNKIIKNKFNKYFFIDYPESKTIYDKNFSNKINYKFISHNDFIKLRFKINNKDQYLGLDFHKKNIFSEKIFMSILSRYQVNQNSFSYIERQNYYKEILNYFYCFLLENKISKIVFYDYPHHIDSYILYVLSKHLNLKIIITSYLFLLGNYRLVFDDSLKNRFHQFKKNQVYKVEKNKVIKLIENYSKSKKHIKPHYIINKKSIYYLFLKDFYRSFKRGFFKESNYHAKHSYEIKFRNENFKSEISSVFTNFIQRKKITKLEREYLKLCKPFNFRKKFILFLPSVQPEASSLPLAGYFNDFKIILDMLQKYLPKNWIILYKEHPLTFDLTKESYLFKNENYYKEISNEKIIFINHKIDTMSLITKSECIATSTGSAGLEASLKTKPVLNFGVAWWSNYKNIFKINNNLDLEKAIKIIRDKKFKFYKRELTKDILNTYKKTIEFYHYNEYSHKKYDILMKEINIDFKNIDNYFKQNLKKIFYL